MKVIFRSKDFASVEAGGFGFNNRRPMARSWQYQGRVQHPQWQGAYECSWEGMEETTGGRGATNSSSLPELIWIVRGDTRLFGLAAALKARGFSVAVEQD